MESKPTFRILFWLNIAKTKEALAPIYARITINGRRAEISLRRQCHPESWDDRAHRIKGRNSEATVLNNYLDAKYAKLLQCYEDLLKEHCIITAQAIKSCFLDSNATFKSLQLELLKKENLLLESQLKAEKANKPKDKTFLWLLRLLGAVGAGTFLGSCRKSQNLTET